MAGDARRYCPLPSPFAMKRGGTLDGAQVAYETWGALNAARDNAVLVLTGLSPSAHLTSSTDDETPGWWQDMAGPGKAIDTTHWFLVCVNSLGSDKGSTGPASIDPVSGEPYRLNFPDLTLEDVANAAHAVTRSLGIERLACLIGCSMGGMGALGYMLLHPGSVRAHISVDTAPQAQPFAIAIRSLQREAIRLDPRWNGGNYAIQGRMSAAGGRPGDPASSDTGASMHVAGRAGAAAIQGPMSAAGGRPGDPASSDTLGSMHVAGRAEAAAIHGPMSTASGRPGDPASSDTHASMHVAASAEAAGDDSYPDIGMSIARKLGVITYRSAMEWNGRFARIRLDPEQRDDEPFAREFEVESYLESHAQRFVRHFDPNCYMYLSRASDWFDIAEYGGGNVRAGLLHIHIEQALVIGVSTDILFPLEQQEQIADGLREAGAEVEFVALDSPQGHDAFLVDIPNFSQAIGKFLTGLRAKHTARC
ncbi:MAG: alpha/beta fold hydrolase [Rhodanobacter sp.]